MIRNKHNDYAWLTKKDDPVSRYYTWDTYIAKFCFTNLRAKYYI
jgi:hypothetical protein